MPDTSRPVNAEPRRRTKNACLTCQRKKLKCNGLQPCATCSSRSNHCTYANTHNQAKRQDQRHQLAHQSQSNQSQAPPYTFLSSQLPLPQVGTPDPILEEHHGSKEHSVGPAVLAITDEERFSQQPQSRHSNQYHKTGIHGASPELSISINKNPCMKDSEPMKIGPEAVPEKTSGSNSEGNHTEESLKEQSRMLQDGKGRLLYLGESASLSYLDTIRGLVESTLGPCNFTRDAHKHKILEGSISASHRATHVLPDQEAAEFLLDSFFSNTVGILYLFDRQTFGNEVAAIYANPLQTEQSRLSILHLVFAVGLQWTKCSATHTYRQIQILKRLDGGNIDRAEIFYLNATHLNDSVLGFEDGDITSIQALLLITVFMLTVAKRNAAWAYFGMAVRSAYALGLHRKQTLLAFSVSEQRLRKNAWRSLYVMDCFLSAMLGRPNSIDSRDATYSFGDDDSKPNSTPSENTLEVDALDASVRSSRLIGEILTLVYAERKISAKLAHRISNKFHAWKNSLPETLHWKNIGMPNEDSRITLAQLHVNLIYFHGIILLTRPFLLQKILSQVREPKGLNRDLQSSQKPGTSEMGSVNAERFPGACVRAALYSIDAVQSALLKRALPRRDPFVLYWLFTAALVVFSNGFCTVYGGVENSHAMQTALNLHLYLSEFDPLARRFLQILQAFDQAIARDTTSRAAITTSKSSGVDIFAMFFGGSQGRDVSSGVDAGPQMESGSSGMHMRTSQNEWGDCQVEPLGVRSQSAIEQDVVQQIQIGSNWEAISQHDYLLDFDTFLTGVSQDTDFQQDPWMPLYGTMDVT